jgi:hypothetical protein
MFESDNPGRDVQRVGTARFLGEDPQKIHDPVWAVTGTLGDSQCYLGVRRKVEAIQAALAARIRRDDLRVRLIPPAFTIGVSDGQLNGTDRMRFSLIGREITNDSVDAHLSANDVKGLIAVVACDKPPVGTLAAVLEHDEPAVFLSDGSIRPGTDPDTGERIDLVCAFQVAGDPDAALRTRIALHACPGQGSCGGMFTYNTMQSFIAVLGMEPLHMVAPASEDPRRLEEFPAELVDCLMAMTQKGVKPRDIVTPRSLRNALTVVIAMGGSTNVALHSVEIARAAGIDLWKDVISQREFNELSRRLPVLINARPYGDYSMVDIDAKGGLQMIVKELLDAGFLDGGCRTCPGETLAGQGRAAVQADGWPPPPLRQPRPRRRGHHQAGRRRGRHPGRRLQRPGACLQQRGGAHRRARDHAGRLRGPRHGGHPLRGTARRARHAGAARPDLAHHGALSPEEHHDRAHDGRPLLGRLGRLGHRPRRPRSVSGRPDRAHRGRRHDRRRPQPGPPRLPRARRRCGAGAARNRLARGHGAERRPPSRGEAGHQPPAQAHARLGAPRARRGGHGDRGVRRMRAARLAARGRARTMDS